MADRPARLHLQVLSNEPAAVGVRTLVFGPIGAEQLPSYVPGSHLVLDCGPAVNAYSLLGPGNLPSEYRISVLAHSPDDPMSGSAWLQCREPGDTVVGRPPRSDFAPVLRARKHLFVAGGIGVTAILPHVREAALWDRDFRLLFGYRPGRGAHLDELRELAGDRLAEFIDRSALTAAIRAELTDQPLGTHLSVCGPAGLIEFCLHAATAVGWPASRMHTERFDAAELGPGKPFRVRLTDSDRIVEVPSGVSLLTALLDSGVNVNHLCRQGVCGECLVNVAAGQVQHRDHVLTAAERELGATMLACVSRAAGPELELRL